QPLFALGCGAIALSPVNLGQQRTRTLLGPRIASGALEVAQAVWPVVPLGGQPAQAEVSVRAFWIMGQHLAKPPFRLACLTLSQQDFCQPQAGRVRPVRAQCLAPAELGNGGVRVAQRQNDSLEVGPA